MEADASGTMPFEFALALRVYLRQLDGLDDV